jgi:Tol biopolymer transport system component
MASCPRIAVIVVVFVSVVPLSGRGLPEARTTRVSVGTGGTEGNGSSHGSALSADGRYAAFSSMASTLVPFDNNLQQDVFVHDRLTGETTIASVASDGTQGNGPSGGGGFSGVAVAINATGRYVAFGSFASNLVPGDTNGRQDIFVHDRDTGETSRISVASDGGQADGESRYPAISADGRYVAFESFASNMVPGDTNGSWDTFVHDRLTGETTRVSVASDGLQGNGFLDADEVSISADGRYVAFGASASNLVPGDTNGHRDVFVRDRVGGVTTRVSIASDGQEGNGDSSGPSISADGRYVSFESGASNFAAGDTNGAVDVFVHDRVSGETIRVDVASDGSQANAGASGASLSADGRFVAFDSGSNTLVPGDSNGIVDVFVRDRVSRTTTRASVANDGAQGLAFPMGSSSISADASTVAFSSYAANLVAGDDNDAEDVFVRTLLPSPDAPTALTGGVAGSTVSLAWAAPAGGVAPTAYQIEAGSRSGRSDLAALSTGNTQTVFTAPGVATGEYFVRVRALNAEWASAPSNEVRLLVGAVTPGAPSGLVATLSGSTISLTWTAPASGGPPSSYLIEAGSAPGLSDLAQLSTGNVTPSFVALGVPNGHYFIRVRSVNLGGTSGPSNEVRIIIGPPPPGPPLAFSGRVAGSAVSLSWTAPGIGGAASTYLIEAGSDPGMSNLASFTTGNPGTTFVAADVAEGLYYLRVKAINTGGTSGPSNEISLVVGCASGPPGAPTGLTGPIAFFGAGYLTWTAPAVIPGIASAATAYVLEAGTAPGLRDFAAIELGGTATSYYFTGLPEGFYYARVKARNACGLSAPSNEFRVYSHDPYASSKRG